MTGIVPAITLTTPSPVHMPFNWMIIITRYTKRTDPAGSRTRPVIRVFTGFIVHPVLDINFFNTICQPYMPILPGYQLIFRTGQYDRISEFQIIVYIIIPIIDSPIVINISTWVQNSLPGKLEFAWEVGAPAPTELYSKGS